MKDKIYLDYRRVELAKMFVAKAYSIEYLAFQDAPDGQFSDEIINPKPPRGQQIYTLCNKNFKVKHGVETDSELSLRVLNAVFDIFFLIF